MVVFLGVFAAFGATAWCGCSSSTSPSTFDTLDAAAADASCQGSLDDCPCGTLADFCSQVPCISTLADAQDAAAWGPVPNCDTEESTNVCSNTIKLAENGIDTGSTLYFDATTGALVAAVSISNLKWSCWGTIPKGNCDDTWTLKPLFGVFDGGVCYDNTQTVDAGADADAGDD